MSKVLQRCN